MSNNWTDGVMATSLNIGLYTGQKSDRTVSDMITSKAGIGRENVKSRKVTIACRELDYMIGFANHIRREYNNKTLAWRDGVRIVRNTDLFDLINWHNQMKADWLIGVDNFINVYPQAVVAAQQRLGSLFDPNDYPSEAEMRKKFYIRFTYETVAMSTPQNDFRITLPANIVSDLEQDMQAQFQEQVNNMNRDLWERLSKRVGALVERLQDPTATFRISTLEALTTVCEEVKRLNVTGDSAIDQMQRDIMQSLGSLDAGALRADIYDPNGYRATTTAKANEFLDKISQYTRK